MAVAARSFSLVEAFEGLSLGSSSSSSCFEEDFGSIHIGHKVSVSFPLNCQLTIESAYKKEDRSTKNGRDSAGKRLGVKIYGDQVAKPGAINVRQHGTKFHPGENVRLGKDHTIFSLIDGFVKFEKFRPDRKLVLETFQLLLQSHFPNKIVALCNQASVYPRVVQPENPNSYRARKRESFRGQHEHRKPRRAL